MTYAVTFTRTTAPIDTDDTSSAVRLNINVNSVVDFADKGIFTFIRNNQDEPVYSGVSTAYDIRNFEFESFGVEDALDFQRRSSAVLEFATSLAMEQFFTEFEIRLQNLCDEMQILSNTSSPVTKTITADV